MLREAARAATLSLQQALKVFPREFCLVSGAPRSGTTAIIDWLHEQRAVAAFQESRILVGSHTFLKGTQRFKNLDRDRARLVQLARDLVLNYYAGSRVLMGKALLVDKEPLEPIAFPARDYGEFLLHVRELFPRAKLLLAVRDPVATVWSMSKRTWGESLTSARAKEFTIEEYAENWCAGAELVLRYRTDPHTCVVEFGRLVRDSQTESRRILEFLRVRNGTPFQARQTRGIGFDKDVRERILQITKPQLDLLATQGISDLE